MLFLALFCLFSTVFSVDKPGINYHAVNVKQQQFVLLWKVPGMLSAFGDYNSDKSTDLIVTRDDNSISILRWDSGAFKFQEIPGKLTIPEPIINIVPGDFNYDGRLDLLVFSQGQGSLRPRIFWGEITGYPTTSLDLDPFTLGQPLMMDYYGTMNSDLVGNPAWNTSQLSIWGPFTQGNATL